MPTLTGRGDDMRGAAVASRGAACDSGAPNPLPPSPTATSTTPAPAATASADSSRRETTKEGQSCLARGWRPLSMTASNQAEGFRCTTPATSRETPSPERSVIAGPRAAVDSLTARPRASLSTSAQTQSETRRRG